MNLCVSRNLSFKYLVAAANSLLIEAAKHLYGSMKLQLVIPKFLHRSAETLYAFQ
jgi:hypothetical protein